MEYSQKPLKVQNVVSTWQNRTLSINEEYQRGKEWKLSQMQGLIDSLFRRYPIPPFFLHQKTVVDINGVPQSTYEIVDGQQRLRALSEFMRNSFSLLMPSDPKLRLPNSLRDAGTSWGGKRFSELEEPDRERFLHTDLDAFIITDVQHRDEVRDLFIRLQSGTALSRQQIRDAWPGPIGPFIETLAGKLDKQPLVDLFRLVDKRGSRSDDDKDIDEFDVDRQFCAQLLRLYIVREGDIHAEVNVGANTLDKLYHEHTDFEPHGASAKRFQALLNQTTDVIKTAIELSSGPKKRKTKLRKLDVFATFQFVQDLSRNPNWRLDHKGVREIAKHLSEAKESSAQGASRSTSGSAILRYYQGWRTDELSASVGIRTDLRRVFDEEQKAEIRRLADGKCAVCTQYIEEGAGEYDHSPLPWAAGGKTEVANGRLVCKRCHPRGRFSGSAPEDDD